jgi:hypothetical protein
MAVPGESAFMALYALDAVENGYEIVPIKLDSKAPVFAEWQKVPSNKKTVQNWIPQYGRNGFGIRTKLTPGVDIDCLDADLVEQMVDFVQCEVGFGPVRVGKAPKTLLVYRSSVPFKKVSSKVWVDEWLQENKVEILGDGQQFVAYGIHPGTKAPYRWIGRDTPLVTAAGKLCEITQEQARAICAEFDRLAELKGWEPKRNTSPQLTNGHLRDPDDVFLSDTPIADISSEQLRAKLFSIPNDPMEGEQDYDTWTNIGMALHHQFDGADEGYDLWVEWSEQSSKHEIGQNEYKWPSFKHDESRAPITARYIIKLAGEFEAEEIREQKASIEQLLANALNAQHIKELCAKVKEVKLDDFDRSELQKRIQKRYKDLTGHVLTSAEVRKLTRYEQPGDLLRASHKWLEDWVFISGEGRFQQLNGDPLALSREAFNLAFAHKLLTPTEIAEGQSVPSVEPSTFAITNYGIPVVNAMIYAPDQDRVFTRDGVQYGNTYSEAGRAVIPELSSARDRENVKLVEKHFEHLIEDELEREMFKSWIAWVVRKPGNRVKWAVLLQGAKGIGKTTLFNLFEAILGESNCQAVSNDDLKGVYNEWAMKSLVFVEEVKAQGSQYDVLSRLQIFITNDKIPIRRMRIAPFNVRNYASYLLTTNRVNALPLSEDENRYYVIFSRWQESNAEEYAAWAAENPKYFDRLRRAISESPGALLKWFSNMKLHPKFNPHGRAIKSEGRDTMVSLETGEKSSALAALLAEGEPGMNAELISSTNLRQLIGENLLEIPLTGGGWRNTLIDAGLRPLGQVRLEGRFGPQETYWSRTPKRFKNLDLSPNLDLMRKTLGIKSPSSS